MRMEERRELFDTSAYMLFEASGDSEVACDTDAALEQESDAAAEDDAQSWCDSFDRLHEVVDGGDDARGGEFDYCSADEEEEEEDGVVDQCRRDAAAPAKSKVFEESNAMMSERERDRLFWEACLAS